MHIRRPAVMQLASLNIAAKSSNYSFHGDLLSVSRFCWGYENLCFAVALFLFMKFEKIHSKTESCFVTELLYSSNRSKKVFWKLVTEPFFHGSFQTWQVMPAIYVLSASLFSLIEPQTEWARFIIRRQSLFTDFLSLSSAPYDEERCSWGRFYLLASFMLSKF